MARCAMVCSLVVLLAMQVDASAIQRLFEENLERQEKQYGANDRHTAEAARDLGLFLKRQGNGEAAAAALARALRADQEVFGMSARETLADAAELAELQPPEKAEPLWQRAAGSPNAHLAARALAALGN